MKKEIEEKILKYFSDTKTSHTGRSFRLKVLDNKYRTYYTGVTLNYITYTLLKAKYKKSDVAECLYDLYNNKQIKSLFCPNIKKVVFESSFSPHYTFTVDNPYADKEMKIEYFNEYMNQFIKKNNE